MFRDSDAVEPEQRHLNLLGLRVRLNQVALLVEAVPSSGAAVPGGLLGDLLCGVTNLLNPGANTPLATGSIPPEPLFGCPAA